MTNQTLKLLLVDDHVNVRRQVSNRLRQEPDINIVSSWGNKNFIQRALRYQPDVILIDPFCRDHINLEGIEQVKKEIPESRIIVLTGIVDTASRIELKKLGVESILEKGISSSEIVKEIMKVATEKKSRNSRSVPDTR
jgi:DNA-binding NarL/FixJ family response regulator